MLEEGVDEWELVRISGLCGLDIGAESQPETALDPAALLRSRRPWYVRPAGQSHTERKGGVSVQAESEDLHELIDADAAVEQIGSGFTFTEGPIWNPRGQYLLFSDMPGDTRRRWDEQSGVREVANPSNKGNGMTLDAQGRLVVCENSTSSVARMDPDGTGSGREVPPVQMMTLPAWSRGALSLSTT